MSFDKKGINMNYLTQEENGITYIHGVAKSVSELIAYYYEYRKQYGYMEVINDSGSVYATLGSK